MYQWVCTAARPKCTPITDPNRCRGYWTDVISPSVVLSEAVSVRAAARMWIDSLSIRKWRLPTSVDHVCSSVRYENLHANDCRSRCLDHAFCTYAHFRSGVDSYKKVGIENPIPSSCQLMDIDSLHPTYKG